MKDRDKTKQQLLTERELAESRAVLQATIESLPFDFFAIGADGRYMMANAACRRNWGELAGRRPEDLAPNDEVRALWLCNNRRAFAGERVEDEVSFTVQGEERHCRNVIAPILKDGQILGILGVNVDITGRVRAEEALKKARDELEEKVDERTAELLEANEQLAVFRRFAEAAGQGFGMADMQGIITYVNPAACRMAGVATPEDALGKHLTAFYPEGYARKRETEIIPALLQNGHWEGELVIPRGETTITVLQHSFLIRNEDGNPSRLASVITDITERKRVEEALLRSCDQLQTIYDNMVEGLLITDTETKRFVRTNASMCRMLGCSEHEVLAASVKDIHPPEEVPNDLQRFQAAAEGRVSINEDRPVLRKDGSIFYADITGHPIVYNGRPCLLALFRDVTERRRAEESLRRERRSLEHMLRASDHERQTIAYDIHDGLAQYLAGAVMQFGVYEHRRPTDAGEAQRAYDHGLSLLRQAHYEARRLISGVRPPILDESGVVAAVAYLVQEQQQQPGPDIEFYRRVRFDRLASILENAVYRIVQEGLTNACRHSRSEMVRVALLQRGDKIGIEIRDWGIGFDPKTVQANRFGLAGIRERARLLGGKCRITSKPGHGAAIVVELPLVERTAQP